MKKITLFLIMLGFCISASAQYEFPVIQGPTSVVSGENIPININDIANTAGVPASSSGSYLSFTVSADWTEGDGFPFNNEAQLTVSTSAGDVFLEEPSTGGGFNSNDTTLTFEGELPAGYDPTTDGFLEITPNQEYDGSDADWSNIVVTLFESPTCITPSSMMTTTLTTTEVDLEWTAGFSETNWNVEYNSGSDFTPGNGEEEASAVVAGTAETSLAGLTPNTEYYVYYQADCGTDDGLSEWAGPFTFYTGLCESIPSSTDGDGIGQVILGTETFTSGGDEITYEDFTSPTVDLAALVNSNLQITFTTGPTYNTNVWIDFNNDLVYDNETEIVFQGTSEAANPTVFNASFLMPDVPLGVYNMRIGTADLAQTATSPDPCYSGAWGVTMDFTINVTAAPNCIPPNALTTNGIGADSAELSWTQVGAVSQWNIEVVPSGTEPTGTPTESDVTNPYTVSGLDALTSYDYYVQANCGSELSAWSGPFTFMTLCDVIIPDYLEDFTDLTDTVPPECWDEADNGDLTTGPTDLGLSSWTVDGFLNDGTTGAYKINVFGTFLNDWLLTPQFDLTGDPFQVEFDFGITQWGNDNPGTLGSDDLVAFLISNDNGATWTSLLSYDSSSVLPANGAHPVVNLSAYSGDIVQFAFYATGGTTSGGDNDVFVDNFQVRAVPSCPEPNDLAVTNITSEGAELSWTEAGTSTIWNVEIVESGETPTGTPTDTNVSNPYIATGLDPVASYDFYVQSDCGGESSVFTGPISFTTLCDVFTPDYIENFANVTATVPPECWDEADNGDLTTGPTDLGLSSWTVDGFLNDGSTGAYKINIYAPFFGDPFNDWILTPQFDLTGGPFQVEFDFGITTWGSTAAGTLGSDDVVEFLISTDNGTTWSSLITYDNTSVTAPNGDHPVIDLTAYSGQIVQFAFYATSGTVDDSADNDIFVDNFRVRGIPTCPEPTDLTATNLSVTSTELSWTESGTATSWNIQYGEAGFTLGDGIVLTDIDTNPYILSDLTADTSYEYYVQAICSPGDESSFNGPFQFFTGYCESIPSSNDGNGVNNVTVGFTDFPSPGDINYENNTSTVVNVFQGLNTNVLIEFGHTITYNTAIWIDFNDDLVFDDTELVFQGESAGGNFADGFHMFDTSFLMPLTAPIGEHRMRIVGTDFADPEPCYNGSWGITMDFTVNVQELMCTLPEASFATSPDCENDQFFIDVDITSLGDADTIQISNDFNSETEQVSEVGTYQAGPFAFGTAVKVFVTNEQDNNCVVSSSTFEVLACPPSNDECEGAITAVVNEFGGCDEVTSGTILAATPSNVPDSSCTGTPNDDVWFEFTALSDVQLISILNVTGGANIDHAVYEGACGSLTELYCSDNEASITPSLTVGSTYYVRVFSGGSQLETATFDLCIRPAPTNTVCENAENFCSDGGALEAASVFGIPSEGPIACLTSAQNPTWNTIQIGNPGQIEITISQVDDDGDGLDVDYALWGPFESVEESCNNLDLGCPEPSNCPGLPYTPEFYPYGNIADCSWSIASVETLTIDNALEGEVYILLVSNFGNQPGTITIEQTNGGSPDDGTIEAEITAEIVSEEVLIDPDNDPTEIDEVSVCGFDSVTITTSSPFADEYEWYEDGFLIPNENSSSLTVTPEGFGLGATNYQVLATDNQCGATALSQIVIVNLYEDPEPLEPQTLTACDGPEADGTETFDLDAFTASLGLEGFKVTYHLNEADASQAINPVASQYDSSGETLIIRIEDENAAEDPEYLGCREISEVELIVNPRPEINQPEDLIVCDDLDGVVDGETEFDLVSINSEVTNDEGMIISYYTSLDNAEAASGALSSPYTSSGETIYVRAEDPDTGCYQTTSFALEVNIVPLAEFDDQYNYIVCPSATVPITIGITPSNFTESDVSISWSLDGDPIDGSGTTLSTVLFAGEYTATITFNESGCSSAPISIDVEEAESCIFPEGISPGVSPGQNDTFDLKSFDVTKLEIFNRYGTLVYSKNNYTDEWVGQSNDGEELPVGTYFYTVEYEGGTKTKSAWVYINR
ncbi:fibronectin type III domain-containing protein [Winogradskyella sp. SM1960]|uniref:fibronectin type III domain-containing protein n=1 Tax=Winogradskyella sp. SM1960 TaxID=2865955 RepID=UPI001CD7DE75|nr:GEVED domain-containing protein [Winogradskyella sp. SM1960]